MDLLKSEYLVCPGSKPFIKVKKLFLNTDKHKL